MLNAFFIVVYVEKGGNERRKKGGVKGVGSGILSHHVTMAVPSALVTKTTGFGMGPGVPSRL